MKYVETFLPFVEKVPVDSLALVHLRVFHYVQYECDSSGCSQMKTSKNTQFLLIMKVPDHFFSYSIIAPLGHNAACLL